MVNQLSKIMNQLIVKTVFQDLWETLTSFVISV